MNPEHMKEREPHLRRDGEQCSRAMLSDLIRLQLDRRLRRARERVTSFLIRKKSWKGYCTRLQSQDLIQLDRREGYPKHYERKELEVDLDDGTKENAWVYIATPNMVAEGLRPTRKYLSHYLKAKDLLSCAYHKKLENAETLD